ncbi:hypothetical protein G3T36_00590 [Diaminobutyricibacter tongyongensis]|uniref:YokE-like PH domain-containing protein n=1 Tax=Leifsonia tongyongensis TaxID=1268043 RepID=A0A6L9XTN7_9MICO|nr:hypothetical protein [Diaminobutyricibacter tongyongensis]NEN04358.1 hypothetical protein [Diaminobutyricibacter tongyongensis]
MTDSHLDAFGQASTLSRLLTTSLANDEWDAATTPSPAGWYLDFVSKILALTRGEAVVYVSTTFHRESGGRAVVLTGRGVITAGVTFTDAAAKVTATRLSRSTLRSIEVVDVDRMSLTAGEEWPRVESVILTFDGTALTLPVDSGTVSTATRQSLDAIVPSLISDLND